MHSCGGQSTAVRHLLCYGEASCKSKRELSSSSNITGIVSSIYIEVQHQYTLIHKIHNVSRSKIITNLFYLKLLFTNISLLKNVNFIIAKKTDVHEYKKLI